MARRWLPTCCLSGFLLALNLLATSVSIMDVAIATSPDDAQGASGGDQDGPVAYLASAGTNDRRREGHRQLQQAATSRLRKPPKPPKVAGKRKSRSPPPVPFPPHPSPPPSPSPPLPPMPPPRTRGGMALLPNFVVIMSDDQDDLLNSTHPHYMPALNKHLGLGGARLTDFTVSTPLCCPARTALLTGQYAHW